MKYDVDLADRVRAYLAEVPNIEVTEKPMFQVLNFMVNGKTCICVTAEGLMLRFDPALQEELSERSGYQTMLMKGKEYKGYCVISPEGFKRNEDFAYYMDICLAFNPMAKASKPKKKS